MDKRLILAVAGSGKTTFLVNQIDYTRRYLIVTYTNNNLNNLRNKIIRKFGYLPNNVLLLSYFQFLWTICYSPYLKDRCKAKGITFLNPPQYTIFRPNTKSFYMTSNGFLYSNRIAKLCQQYDLCKLIANRIDKYFDCFYFDEVQDLAGHDFNFALNIIPENTDVLFVGDFYQHTFDTSRDGNLNKGLYDNYKRYCKKWITVGFSIDTESLSKSYRCSPSVCSYVQNYLGIRIESHRSEESLIVFVDQQLDTDELVTRGLPFLFFRNRNKYLCNGMNWGETKGLDTFEDVAIVLHSDALIKYRNNMLNLLASETKNKLYVACTRARGNIYFIPYNFMECYKKC